MPMIHEAAGMRERDIFIEVLEQNDPSARATVLDDACRDDAALRQRVEQLLAEHDRQRSFILDEPPPGLEAALDQTTEGPGALIGCYKLVQQIGEGGFGVVFLAEQERPVRRRVALKIIKPGMDTRQVIARFEAERQALAIMDHSSIAKVFDAGATDTGRPYFVMELVQGAPITDYCNQCGLTTRERLGLFVAVCHAVQHAHQKGVIHRDIKPTNVLVTIQNGRPEPKIIDFGVAKALNQRLTDHTLVTAFAQMVGTPLYMSPEQAELSSLGVDTRTDIYSLGVLLYELLTGTTPFDKQRLHLASYDELRQILREEEPPLPSARFSTLEADLATTVAEQHRTDTFRLAQTIRGELDWIAMKCLDKDRNRRYETAGGLARDIERYLRDEPVSACPPSAVYRFRKFARRHKGSLLAAAAAVVALLALVAGLAVSNRLIAAARERAEEQRLLAMTQAAKEQRASNQARAEAAKATAVVALMQDMLTAAHPDSATGKEFSVRELLGQFSQGLEDRLQDQPEVEATLRQIIGSVYTRLRLMDEAEPHLRRSLVLHRQIFGEDHVKYADSLRHLAWNLLEKDRASEEVEVLARAALEVYRDHSDDDGALQAWWLLVLSLDGQSKPGDAEVVANDALALARERGLEDHEVVPSILHQLAWINIRRGQYALAEKLARESVDGHLRVHGAAHPETAFGWTYLGAALSWQGKFAEAEECLRKSLSIFRRSFPEEHKFLRPTWNDLQSVLSAQGKYDEVIRQCREAIDLDPDNAEVLNRLAWVLGTCPAAQYRDPAAAVELASKAVALEPQAGVYWNTLGVAQYRMGRWAEAIEALEKSTDLRRGGDGNDWLFLAMAEWQRGNREAAHDWYGKAVEWMAKRNGHGDELIRFRAEAKALFEGAERSPAADSPTRNTPP